MKQLNFNKRTIIIEVLLFAIMICLTTGCDIIKNSNKESNGNTNTKEEVKSVYNFEADFVDVKRVNGKVNIYVFWGDGCPHCSALHTYLDTLTEKYGEYFNLYGFEVWYNSNNSKMGQQFAEAMGDKFEGVPYYIIGEESFSGYGESYNQRIIDNILDESNRLFDVYFDVIKKNE